MHGILDQVRGARAATSDDGHESTAAAADGVLVTFEHKSSDETYEAVLQTVSHMSKVVDALYHKAKRLS